MGEWRVDGHGESLWVDGQRVGYVVHEPGGALGKAYKGLSAESEAKETAAPYVCCTHTGPDAVASVKLWVEAAVVQEMPPPPKRKRS